MDDLVGVAEIAEMLHAKRVQRVYEWKTRYIDTDHPFPDPIKTVNRKTSVWLASDVRKWAAATGRLPGK